MFKSLSLPDGNTEATDLAKYSIDGRPPRKDSVLVFDNGQPLRKFSELLFEKKLLIPALRQLVSSHPRQHDG